MIKTDKDYQEAQAKLADEEFAIEETKKRLKEEGIPDEVAKNILDPLTSFHLQLKEEVETYERIRDGKIDPVSSFKALGRSLIAMRIASGMSQLELANAIGTTQPVVNRFERNEYHGAKKELIDKVTEALGFETTISFKRVG